MFINNVIVGGNVAYDPNVTPVNDTMVARFRIISNRPYVSNGEKKEETSGIDIEAWGKNAELISKYVVKGKFVVVSGYLKEDRWEDKEGNKRSRLTVVADAGPKGIQFGPGPKKDNAPADNQDDKSQENDSTNDDDVPF